MGNRKQVYVSSTFVDLQGFREKVLERLRGSNSIAIAMEDYPAFDERPANKCLADVANSNIYVGILAKRYGYIPEDSNPEGLSITEMEYRKAGDAGLTRLMFQLDPEEPWRDKFNDKVTGEGDDGKRIDRFRADVSDRHGIRTFRNPLIHLAPGMGSFYLDAFERRFARADKDYTPVREVLGILAIAREPLPLATIAEILDQPEAQVKAVRSALPDFLRLRGSTLTFDHFSMTEWLTSETVDGFARAGGYAVDGPASEARLHRWALCKVSEGKAHTSEYLVRHLALHLADADERRRTFTQLMLSSPEWLAVRLRLSGIEALIADCDHLDEAPAAALLRALLRNSAYVLRSFPDQLPAQLLGRIRSLEDPANPLAELANCIYGLLPFCKRIILLTNLSTTASVYPASVWGCFSYPPSHDEYPLTRG